MSDDPARDMRDEEELGIPDEVAILSRRRALIATALTGAAALGTACPPPPMPCLSPPVPAPRVTFTQGDRPAIRYGTLPPGVLAHLPPVAVYVSRGVSASPPQRYVLDFYGVLVAREGAREWTVNLSTAQIEALARVADRVWREGRATNPNPTDGDEVIVLRDRGEGFIVAGSGALRGGAAEELVTRLRALAETGRPPAQQP